MAKKKKEVVEETTKKTEVNEPKGKETKGDVTKVEAKMKKEPEDLSKATITKVDLNKPLKPEENETKENTSDDSGVVT